MEHNLLLKDSQAILFFYYTDTVKMLKKNINEISKLPLRKSTLTQFGNITVARGCHQYVAFWLPLRKDFRKGFQDRDSLLNAVVKGEGGSRFYHCGVHYVMQNRIIPLKKQLWSTWKVVTQYFLGNFKRKYRFFLLCFPSMGSIPSKKKGVLGNALLLGFEPNNFCPGRSLWHTY